MENVEDSEIGGTLFKDATEDSGDTFEENGIVNDVQVKTLGV